MSRAWLLDAPDPHPARTSAGVPSPGAGRSRSATPPAASRTRVGPGPGACPDPSVAALGLGHRGWPPSPSAACQNWPSSFGVVFSCFFAVPEHLRLPEPGLQFREGRGLSSPVAQVGYVEVWPPDPRQEPAQGFGARCLSRLGLAHHRAVGAAHPPTRCRREHSIAVGSRGIRRENDRPCTYLSAPGPSHFKSFRR
jgi:hypothetical protein